MELEGEGIQLLSYFDLLIYHESRDMPIHVIDHSHIDIVSKANSPSF